MGRLLPFYWDSLGVEEFQWPNLVWKDKCGWPLWFGICVRVLLSSLGAIPTSAWKGRELTTEAAKTQPRFSSQFPLCWELKAFCCSKSLILVLLYQILLNLTVEIKIAVFTPNEIIFSQHVRNRLEVLIRRCKCRCWHNVCHPAMGTVVFWAGSSWLSIRNALPQTPSDARCITGCVLQEWRLRCAGSSWQQLLSEMLNFGLLFILWWSIHLYLGPMPKS